MKNCLECNTRLVDKDQDAKKKQDLQTYTRALGVVAIIAILFLLVWFVLLPLLNFSMVSGQDFSAVIRADAAEQSAAVSRIPLDQVVSNNVLEVGVVKTREGTNVLNANRLYFVTVSLKNLKAAGHVIVSGSDFILVDSNGTSYYTYGIDDKIAQDLAPLESRSFELNFEIPRNTRDLTLHFYFPKTGATSASNTPVVFTLPGNT